MKRKVYQASEFDLDRASSGFETAPIQPIDRRSGAAAAVFSDHIVRKVLFLACSIG
jgi:hypothetical protein